MLRTASPLIGAVGVIFMIDEDNVTAFDEEFASLCSEANDLVLSAIAACPFKSTLKAMASLVAATDSIKLGVIQAARAPNAYCTAILYRSVIEHFVRFEYLYFRLMESKSDDAGKEFELYSHISEAVELANAWKLVKGLKGSPTALDPIEVLKELPSVPRSLTKKDIESIVAKWKYRSAIRFIAKKFQERGAEATILLNMIPAYAELSSFVHGGKAAEHIYSGLFNSKNESEEAWHHAQWACILANSMKPQFALILAKSEPLIAPHVSNQMHFLQTYLGDDT